MAAAHVFFSFSVQPLHHSASPVAGNGGRSGRNRAFFRPSTVIYPGREPASHELSDDFDFQESLTNVQALLHHHPTSRRGLLTTVDHLKRLCIDHYFQDEIDTVMGSCADLIHSDDLLDATLSLRLMREAGYYVSADDVLRKFANDNGEFNLGLSKDIRGLLSLQDMSHLNMGESSLYKANEFSSKHLRFAIKYLEPNLARYVRRSLDHPYHLSLMQYKARHHLSYLQNLPTRNTSIENLALAEFTVKKLQHQREMQEVKRWWMDLGLAQEIPAARDQVLKWYMWPMTVLEGFSFSRYRIEITKIISMVYIVDDIFDLVATQEELSLFNEAIKMWDLAAVDSLPNYMISCYKALYTVTSDIADMVRKEHGLSPINHLKKAWATLFDGFMIEGKWLSTNQVPTSEDYLRNGIVTSGAPLVFLHLFFMLGHYLPEGKNDDIHRVISCSAKIMRLCAEFERLTRDADIVQQETLRRILAENGATEYLQGLGLAGRTDPVSFRECVPLATHADLEPYIERIVDGDATPVLTGKPVTSISLSSGTTQGKRKYLLFNEELVKSTMQIYRTSYAFRNREFPVEDGKALQFIYSSRQFTTKGGLTATTATTNVYRSEEFKATMREVQSQCCSPDEVIFGADFAQSLYCHLLCGLLSAGEVQMVSATFAHSVVLAFQTFERVWEELCADIRRGALSPTRVTSPAVRQAVSALLAGPDPELADAVARKCAGLSNWYGVIPALWPNAKYVYAIMTGSMEHYVKKLRHYAGGLPLVAAEYGASEGWIGANVEPAVPPESATFTVLPDIGYFEFIPLRPGCTAAPGPDACYGESEPVGLTDVVVGEHYEVVMTTFAGLYRYRLGDVVQVAGFHNATPKLKFVCRRNLVLSINIDKNSEQDLQLAVDTAAAKFLAAEKLEVVDYTSHADMSSDPGHYVVFVELNAAAADASADALQGCCDELDRSFADPGYVGSRRSCAIGPLELRVLQRGTFHRVLRHYLSLGAPVSQFKSPRCVARSNASVLQILAACTAKVFFSAAYD